MSRRCLNCGHKIEKYVMHCMVNGNDYDFCSEVCIREYSFLKRAQVILIEEFELKEPEWYIS